MDFTVKLIGVSNSPLADIVGSAKSCYSTSPVIKESVTEKELTFATGLLKAGHHTTFQHTYLTFLLDGVSREALREFFHAHPFYNSEQQSQRYTVQAENVYFPASYSSTQPALVAKMKAQAAKLFEQYRQFIDALIPIITPIYKQKHPKENEQSVVAGVRKLAAENARYCLPIGSKCHLYHTVNLMTLLRYRTASTFDVASEEIKLITEAMWQSVIALYPELQQVAESLEKTALSQEKLSSQLEQDCLDYRPQAEKTQYFGPKVILKRSTAVGILGLDGLAIEAIRRAYPFWAAKSDEDVLRLAIQEIGNLNLKLFSPASQALNQISFQFQLTNSLAADMQLQRHRSAQAARPPLLSLPLHDDDFYTPAIFSALPQLESLYQATVQQAIQFARYWINEGVKEAGYLLPNATLIRYDVKEDYLGLLHKAKMRTCFNAQAEAFIQAVEMAQAVSRVAPLLGSYLMPPCVENHQNRDYPVCKEVRYCGIPAWKLANHREFLEKYFSFSV